MNDETMRVLKTATCPTLTGKSTLTYQIGCDPESSIHLRIIKNSGGGFFSDEWIAYDDIQAAIKSRHEGSDLSTYLLIPLYKGKSVNTPSFLLAALKHLKLIKTLPGKKRLHEALDPRPFLEEVARLMSSGTAKAKSTPRKKTTSKKAAVRKAAIKKKALSRKKAAKTVRES